MSEKFKAGQIVNYEYLWNRHAKEGRANAEKPRTACLSMVIKDAAQGITHLIILPISSKPPQGDQDAIEIPVLELRRAGLADYKSGWVTVSEYNYDVLERSYYFDPNQTPRGHFSGPFMKILLTRFGKHLREKRGRIDRTK